MANTTNALLDAVTAAINTVITWTSTVITSITSGELSVLLPLFAITIAVSAFMLGIKCIKSFCWGA